jgi:hypothetical protein
MNWLPMTIGGAAFSAALWALSGDPFLGIIGFLMGGAVVGNLWPMWSER